MSQTLLEADAPREPFKLFADWFEAARQLPGADPTAMALATADGSGVPAVRMVLMKSYGPHGFFFYTNYRSRKAGDLEANPRAALLFWWPALGRQVRIEGRVEQVTAEESDRYFASRDRLSRIGAWASEQSRVIPDRDALQRRVIEFERRYPDDVPRPPHWGGYRVIPQVMEFWQDRPNRLHDRLRYSRDGDSWRVERLAP